MTDVDDQGRVNPFPLFRVQTLVTPPAATDFVLSNGRDMLGEGAVFIALPWRVGYAAPLPGHLPSTCTCSC